MESLSNSRDTTITSQVKTLVSELCRIHSYTLPEEVEALEIPQYPKEVPLESDDDDGENDSMVEDGNEDMESMFLNSSSEKTADGEEAGLDPEHQQLLAEVAQKQLENNLEVTSSC